MTKNNVAALIRWRVWADILLLIFVCALSIVYYRIAWHDIPSLVVALDHCDDLFCDFILQYYPTGQQVLTTGEPSNGYFYTSFFALFLAGFGRFAEPIAIILWGIFQLFSLLLLLIPTIYFYQQRPFFALLYLTLVLLSMPVLHNLKWGQLSVFITGMVFLALALAHRQRDNLAVIALTLATAVKYYAILFIFYYLLRKQWRPLCLFAATTFGFVIVLPVLVLGWETNWQFYQTVSERIAHARTTWMPQDPNSQYIAHVAGRLAHNLWQTSTPHILWQGLGYMLAGGGLLAIVWIVWHNWQDAIYWHTATLFLILPFITETSWPHYFVYLPFVQLFFLTQLWPMSWSWRIAGMIFWLPSIIIASMPFFGWVNDRGIYARYGVLFWADALLFGLFLMLVLPRIWYEYRQRNNLVRRSWAN